MLTKPSGESGDQFLHSFYVDGVKEEDFANYSCVAFNSMGREKANIELRGRNEGRAATPTKLLHHRRGGNSMSIKS